jgi:hypothetical protein
MANKRPTLRDVMAAQESVVQTIQENTAMLKQVYAGVHGKLLEIVADLDAFLSMRDSRRAGKAIMTLIAKVSLEAYQDADIDGF